MMIEKRTNGAVTAYVGHITHLRSYNVVIIKNARYSVTPNVQRELECPTVVKHYTNIGTNSKGLRSQNC